MPLKSELRSRGSGALLGHFIGDALGAPLEFIGRCPTPGDVKSAMSMPGGGWWMVAPGQVTDDGELTIALARGLLEVGSFEGVAEEYHRWFLSRPFDMGRATGRAFGSPKDPAFAHFVDRVGLERTMNVAAVHYSSESEANGSLMRCLPIAFPGWFDSVDAVAAAGERDSAMSHPHRNCCHAVAAYLILARSCIDTGEADFDAAQAWLEKQKSPVAEWMREAVRGNCHPAYPQIGYLKIAFTRAVYHLHRNSDFTEAMEQVLSEGGDTDTNAAIVGGLLGAKIGKEKLPTKWVEAILSSDNSKTQKRPTEYHPSALSTLLNGS